MDEIKVGARLRSSVCTTEVMVVAVPDAAVTLTCGGAPMVPVGEPPASGCTLDAGAAAGTRLGKRNVDETGELEVLCTKGGEGSLAANGVLLREKEAKKLPASD